MIQKLTQNDTSIDLADLKLISLPIIRHLKSQTNKIKINSNLKSTVHIRTRRT